MTFGCRKSLRRRSRGSARLLRGFFYPNAAAVTDRAYFRPAGADHADDRRTTAELRPRPEFHRKFGVDRPAEASDRQVEIAVGRQGQNDIAAETDKLVMPAIVKLAREKHAAAVCVRQHIFAIN